MCTAEGGDLFDACEEHFKTFKLLPYYRACIFGEQMYFEEKETKYKQHFEAFYYTPSGLQLFQSLSITKNTKDFCATIPKSLGVDYQLIAILGDHFNNPDGNTDLYAFFKHVSGKVDFYKWMITQNIDLANPSNISWQITSSAEDSHNDSNIIDSINYLWFHNVLLGLSSQKVSDLPIYMSMSNLSARYDWRSGTFKVKF